MSYRLRSTRRLAKKSRKNLALSIIVILFLIYATLSWLLPNFIDGLGIVRNLVKPPVKAQQESIEALLAPPVLNIPFEATNTAKINITGYSTANSKVKIFLDDELKDTVDVDPDGTFISKDLELVLGNNNIYSKSLDSQDKESLPSKTIKVLYVNSKPKLVVNEPEDGKIIQGDKKVKVSGKVDTEISVFINGSRVITNSDGSFSIDQPINEGDNTITVKAVDQASNQTEISRKVTFNP